MLICSAQADLMHFDIWYQKLGNGGDQSVDFGSANQQKSGFFAPQIFTGARMNTHIADKIFQDTPRCVAKFHKNQPRDV